MKANLPIWYMILIWLEVSVSDSLRQIRYPLNFQSDLLNTISKGTPVYGVTNFQGLIHVIHEDNPFINVFDDQKYRLQTVKQNTSNWIQGPYDLALNIITGEMYFLDWAQSNLIIRVQVRPNYQTTSWNFTLAFTTGALAVSYPGGDVIVTDSAFAEIKVFSSTGHLKSIIKLTGIVSPRHAVKLSSDEYAVCFGYSSTDMHQVCRVNLSGKIVGTCFGSLPGNNTNQLNVPSRLVTSVNGWVYVADMLNSRIIRLNYNLAYPKVILDKSNGLIQPYRLFLEDDTNLLYVADNIKDPIMGYATQGRVLIFNI